VSFSGHSACMLKVSWSPDASFMSKSVYQLDVGTYQDLLTVRYCTYYRLHNRSSLTTEVLLTESCPNLDSLNEYSLRGYCIMKINLLAYKLAKSAKLYACGLCVMRVFRSA